MHQVATITATGILAFAYFRPTPTVTGLHWCPSCSTGPACMVGGVCGGGEAGRARVQGEALATVPLPYAGGGTLIITVTEFSKVCLAGAVSYSCLRTLATCR